jgi:CheY-like chemotaxis protein
MINGVSKVLVIDDEPLLADLLSAILEGPNYQTVIASNGTEGVQLARTVSPAIVFCDMSMPGMSGEEVIRTLRTDPATAALPLVLMSGDEPADRRAICANAFLPKPFAPDKVLELVRTLALPARHLSERLAAA